MTSPFHARNNAEAIQAAKQEPERARLIGAVEETIGLMSRHETELVVWYTQLRFGRWRRGRVSPEVAKEVAEFYRKEGWCTAVFFNATEDSPNIEPFLWLSRLPADVVDASYLQRAPQRVKFARLLGEVLTKGLVTATIDLARHGVSIQAAQEVLRLYHNEWSHDITHVSLGVKTMRVELRLRRRNLT